MSDTPETNAVAEIGGNWDTKALRIGDHARRLERERDEALNAIRTYKCEVEAWELLREARRERDEAREQNAKLREIAERAIDYLDQSYRDGFRDEANDLRYELKQLNEAVK